MEHRLQEPRIATHNVRIYAQCGILLASLPVASPHGYITYEMIYRYCSMIFIIHSQEVWSLFPLLQDGLPGRVLHHDRQTLLRPGNYIVLRDSDQKQISVQLTSEEAPRRVRTNDYTTRTQGTKERDRLQLHLRRSLCERDTVCAMNTISAFVTSPDRKYRGLEAAHVFPVSQLAQWNRNHYRRYITDTSPAVDIGDSGLYSPQNGLLLSKNAHDVFDDFLLGVDPDAGYKIVVFGQDIIGLGGTCLKDSARNGTNQTNRVSPDLLRWHLRMCVYRNMKANAEPPPLWEDDLGSDDMGQILEQPDAADRMEVELFTRLGGLVA